MSKFFKVVKEGKIECNNCHSQADAYIIVYHDGKEECGTGHSYGVKEDALEICQALNWAYQLGKSSKSKDGGTK